MNRFTLRRVPGSQCGIFVGAVANTVVRNGIVRDWGQSGIRAIDINAANSLFEDLRYYNNGYEAVGVHGGLAARNCFIKRCFAENNRYRIYVFGGSGTVIDCMARTKSSGGIFGSIVMGCYSEKNVGAGIIGPEGSIIADCMVKGNANNGISAGWGSNVRGCASYANGGIGIVADHNSSVSECTSALNGGHGVFVYHKSRVANNQCSGNGTNVSGGGGVHAQFNDNRIEGNSVVENDEGISVQDSGNLIAGNCASGDGINYNIVASNMVGTVVIAPESAAIPGSIGGAGVGTINPWENLSY